MTNTVTTTEYIALKNDPANRGKWFRVDDGPAADIGHFLVGSTWAIQELDSAMYGGTRMKYATAYWSTDGKLVDGKTFSDLAEAKVYCEHVVAPDQAKA